MAVQVKNGKAFEYACLMTIYNALSSSQVIQIVNSPQLSTAMNFFGTLSAAEQQQMTDAANAAFRVIDRLEPQLRYPENNIPLFLSLQPDSQGIAGDVRDIICLRDQNGWQIGISCKHNHHAVKHSRLSATIDFGRDWLGIPCSAQYFAAIQPVFTQLQQLQNSGILWSDVENKAQRFYLPILQAFLTELQSLANANTNVPQLLIQYLLGRFDFYKVIADDDHCITRVEAMNFSGTLNLSSGGNRSIVRIPKVQMPTRFYFAGMKPYSDNTVIVACDGGWEISMRIHNASSQVEPSLKFDVQLISLPNTIYAQVEPW